MKIVKGCVIKMSLQLVPLNIPSDWTVVWNHFYEINPDDFHDDSFPYVWELHEDIFYFRNEKTGLILDLGWYPAMRSEGAYTLNLVKIGDEETGPEYWANPILKYCSRKINDITNIIHEVLNKEQYDSSEAK
ncbi:hypothetical protein CA600_29820 [Paenibacillus sp. VTT E-133280]|jgi:hypothetical protein|uniref:hypothetical protein n=1 Tax=unclassified Paenibacillus TaxID=185978 RepID=UPI000B9FCFD6|nr:MULTISPECIES: hypothetical protein [unclassified Paenibacillus]MDH6369031.1 hypothetical protein [Paenibacillus sp. PastF-3]OZQ59300.1 hypothetical protein CA600_29820 [Paenibacillus sp. VTT E-133280]